MKGIELCADCGYYDMKHHSCKRGCTVDPDINKGEDVRFYVDCPLPDVQPVKHGRWKQIGEQSAKCTACGGVLKSNGKDKTGKALIFNAVYHYCPHCGATMDGDANE